LLETRNTEAAGMAGLFALVRRLDRPAPDPQHARRSRARARPGWRCRAELARSHILRCQGQNEVALVVLELALQDIGPEHMDFVAAAAAHLDLLNLAHRFPDALRIGRTYLEQVRSHRAPTFRVELALARTRAELQHFDEAEQSFESVGKAMQSRNIAGILLGRLYEIGARIALLRRNAQLFGERCELCAHHYAIAQNSSLALRYAGLLRDASRAGLSTTASWESGHEGEEAVKAAMRELAEVTSDTAFHARALDLLMRSSGAAAGFLYARAEEGVRQVARTHTGQWTSTIDLDHEAQQFFERDSAADESTKALAASEVAQAQASSRSAIGNELWTCPIARTQDGERVLEGVVLLFVPRAHTIRPGPVLLEELAQLMTVRSQHSDGDRSRPRIARRSVRMRARRLEHFGDRGQELFSGERLLQHRDPGPMHHAGQRFVVVAGHEHDRDLLST
jgi:hypothetical protein